MYSCNYWTYHEHACCYCAKDKDKRLLPVWIIQALQYLWYKVEYKIHITKEMINKLNYELNQDMAWFRKKLMDWNKQGQIDWIKQKREEDPDYCILWKPLNNLFNKT